MTHERLEAREYTIPEILGWEDPEWVVEQFLEERSCCFLSAQPKMGKSLYGLRLGAAVSSGEPLFGYKTKRSNVLYLAAERAPLMKRRITALQRYGIAIDPERFRIWPHPVMFSDHEAVRVFVESLRTVPRLLIVDTLRRTLVGDERSNECMGKWTRGVELFRDLTGAAVLAIHHDQRPSYTSNGRKLTTSFSGAGTILGNLDGYFSMRAQPNGSLIIRSEGSNERNAFHVTTRIISVDIGNNRTTGVMVADDADDQATQPKLDQLALDILDRNPSITQKQWHELCKTDATIRSRWPNLDKGTISRIKTANASLIQEVVNPAHKQQPFLSIVRP